MLKRSSFSRFRASTVVRRARQPPAYFSDFAANLTAAIDKKLDENNKRFDALETAQKALGTKIDGFECSSPNLLSGMQHFVTSALSGAAAAAASALKTDMVDMTKKDTTKQIDDMKEGSAKNSAAANKKLDKNDDAMVEDLQYRCKVMVLNANLFCAFFAVAVLGMLYLFIAEIEQTRIDELIKSRQRPTLLRC
jgi:hypothetical protein